MRFLLAIISLFLLGTTPLRADEPPAPFIVRPVITDFQRSRLPNQPNAVAVVNPNLFVDGENVPETTPAATQLKSALNSAAKRSGKHLHLLISWQGFDRKETLIKKVETAYRSWAQEAGFEKVDVYTQWTSVVWADQRREILAKPDAGDDAVEHVILTSQLRVSPIKTHLSRFLGGNTDCLVDLRRPIDGRIDDLPESLKGAIIESVRQAEPTGNEMLQFHVTSTEAGRRVIERAFDSTRDSSTLNRLRRSLGFKQATYSHTPCGGAPETLIGQPAPDFTLDQLEGDKFTLSESIRGKAAFISFWGIACGPCRREAPYLTALHRRFADEGFTIVAVNAYNEPREKVEEFAKKSSLSHPILLNGGDTAGNVYKVGAYPTGFWVDHTGRVIDYDIDFSPGDEVEMAERITALLKDRKAAGGR
jgi:thiol-disulfide isomerase/thioredoxin